LEAQEVPSKQKHPIGAHSESSSTQSTNSCPVYHKSILILFPFTQPVLRYYCFLRSFQTTIFI